jgi:hypothetical protein
MAGVPDGILSIRNCVRVRGLVELGVGIVSENARSNLLGDGRLDAHENPDLRASGEVVACRTSPASTVSSMRARYSGYHQGGELFAAIGP